MSNNRDNRTHVNRVGDKGDRPDRANRPPSDTSTTGDSRSRSNSSSRTSFSRSRSVGDVRERSRRPDSASSDSRTDSRSDRSRSDVSRTDNSRSGPSDERSWTGSESDSDSQADSYGDNSMTSYFNRICDTTLNVLQKRRDRRGGQAELRRTDHNNLVNDAIWSLVDEILETWKDKVDDAAAKGFSNVNIYEFAKGQEYKGLPVVLLVSGPRNDADYFKRNGMFSVVEELENELRGQRFRVESKFVSGINVINISWRHGLFQTN